MLSRYKRGIAFFLVLLLGIVIYFPSFQAPFQLDDYARIVENSTIKNIRNVDKIWRFGPSRFLTNFSFALNYHFGALNVLGYHGVNVLLHLLTTWVFYLFAHKTLVLLRGHQKGRIIADQKILIFASLIFLCHPLQTSAVTYIVQRSTIFTTLFYLTAIWSYAQYRTQGKMHYYIVALLTASLGIFSKPIIMTLPLAMLVYDFFFIEKSWKMPRRIIWQLLPFVALVLFVPVLLVLWKYKAFDFGKIASVTRETAIMSRQEYLFTQLNVLVTYLRLLIFPFSQNLDYEYPIVRNLYDLRTVFCFAFLTFLMIAAFQFRRRQPLIAFGITWFFLTLSVESSIFPISDVIFEHRLYLPMGGIALGLAGAIVQLKGPAWLVKIIMVLIVSGCALLTFNRNSVWRDPLALAMDTVRKSPNKARPHRTLGFYYTRQGLYGQALEEYNKALAMGSHEEEAYNSRGSIYLKSRQFDAALRDFNSAVDVNPRYFKAYNNRGILYGMTDQFDLSLWNFNQALELNPYFAEGYENRGTLYSRLGQYDMALQDYTRALELEPHLAIIYFNRAMAYASLNDYPRALSDLRKAKLLGYQEAEKYLRSLSQVDH